MLCGCPQYPSPGSTTVSQENNSKGLKSISSIQFQLFSSMGSQNSISVPSSSTFAGDTGLISRRRGYTL